MRERIHAPDLTSASGWLNTRAPLSLRDLRRQIVILDFWTYCCITCMHVLPILRDLEERHRSDPLVVIGVHSAKFDAEKDDARILAAMRRYGVSHPVAVDSEMRIWSQYAVRSWPTLAIVRPDGTLAAVAPGEPDPAVLESFVQQLLADSRAAGTLAAHPARFEAEAPEPERPLLYPGKVAHGGDKISSLAGGPGLFDFGDGTGAIRTGMLQHPLAVAATPAGLLVADTYNDKLKRISPDRLRLERFHEGDLSQPAGLCVLSDGSVLVADTNHHRIVRVDADGSAGRELLVTGAPA